MTCIGFTPQLFDLGGQPVCWDTDLRCPVQDPTTGGTNVYSSGDDVFQNAQGDTYYRVSVPDGTVYLLNHVTPPSQQANQQAGSQQPANRPGSPSTGNPQVPVSAAQVGGAAPVHTGVSGSAALTTTSNQAGAGTGTVIAGGVGGIGNLLGSQWGIGSFNMPVWAWLGGGLALASVVRRGRRHGGLL